MSLPNMTASRSLRPAAGGLRGEPATDSRLFAESSPARAAITPQACSCGGQGTCTCGKGSPQSYVYAIGGIRPAFPSLSVEKEFYQAVSQADSTKPPDKRLVFETLSRAENLYIAREMCWVLQKGAGKVDYFIVKPRSYEELTGLIESIAPRDDFDFDVIIGLRGPVAPPDMCNGLRLPVVICSEAFDFTDREMIAAIELAVEEEDEDGDGDEDKTTIWATDIFWEIIKLTNNTGDTDEYRAINFLATRYLGIYQTTYYLKYKAAGLITHADPSGYSLMRVAAQPAVVQGTRKILDVIFTYRGNSTNAMLQWFCSVDVTGLFPALVTPMTRHYGYY
jgi:hypothetical protein